jgi:hypothetical protein
MVNDGLVEVTIVDDFMADFWSQVFPNLALHQNAAIRMDGNLAIAVRKATGKELLEFWNWRKADPKELPQPQKQWPKGRADPETLKRMLSAALEDRDRLRWTTFD